MARRGQKAAAAPAVVQTQPEAAKKKGGNLRLQSVVPYLQTLDVRRLDGVHNALTEKMAAIGVEPNKRAHQAFALGGNDAPSGNIRGVLNFIDGATADDAETLQTLDAVVTARFKAAGYTPKQTEGLD